MSFVQGIRITVRSNCAREKWVFNFNDINEEEWRRKRERGGMGGGGGNEEQQRSNEIAPMI